MPSPEFPHVLWSACHGVGTIVLNRPERLNAMDHGPGSMQRELVEAIEIADADPEVRCVVVTGAGRAFSSGGVMAPGTSHPGNAVDWYRFLAAEDADNERIRALSTPVIGAINGMCYGAALMMSLHFDILIAAESARFGLIETRFGSVGAEMLLFHVGPQWAKFLAMSGELIDARTAHRIGLVLETVPDDLLLDRVADLARRIASIPGAGPDLNRRVINAGMDAMGWSTQKRLAGAFNALTNSQMREARTPDGSSLFELMADDWEVYKAKRDAPFEPPWLFQSPQRGRDDV